MIRLSRFRQTLFALGLAVGLELPAVAAGATNAYTEYRRSDGSPQSVLLSYYDGPDTRGFAWQTSTGTTSGALWLLAGDFGSGDDDDFSTNRVATADSVKHDDCYTHKAHVLGLRPGTYSYRLGEKDRYAYGQFTVKAEASPFVALNINDVQTKIAERIDCWDRTVASAKSVLETSDVDMIISGGDFIDGSGLSYSYYCQWGVVADKARPAFADVPWTMVSGNHDPSLYDAVIDEHYMHTASGHWGCHSYDVGNVHVAAVPYYSSWSSQVGTWLQNDLNARTSLWCVVVMHYGPYTTCDHGSGASDSYVKAVAGICAKGKVDLVLQAHDHGYSKTLPYRWSAPGYATSEADKAEVVNVEPDIRVIGGEVYYDNPEGTVYLSAGCAGHRVGENKTYATTTYKKRSTKIFVDTIKTGPSAGAEASLVPDDQMFGVLRIDGELLVYDWYLAKTDGSTVLFDTLRICKSETSGESDPETDPEIEDADPEVIQETLFYTEVATHVLSTTNGANAVWSATSSGGVRLMNGTESVVERLDGTGTNFVVAVNGYTAKGSGTVTVTCDGIEVVRYQVSVLADLDEGDTADDWRSAVKTAVIHVGESFSTRFRHPSGSKYWRYADGLYNTSERTKYTCSETATVVTDPVCTENNGARYTTSASRAFSATFTPTETGRVFVAVFFGSNKSNQRHYAGVYELTVLPTSEETWDIPGGRGGIMAIADPQGGKYVRFTDIAWADGKLSLAFEAAKVDAEGETFVLVCKENLADDTTFTVDVTLKNGANGTTGRLEGTTDRPSLVILGIGPRPSR